MGRGAARAGRRCSPTTRAAAAAGAAIAGSASHVQLGRGFLFAVALEGALKVAETTGLASSGFSVADFLHGPIAIARQGTSVVAYAAPGPVAGDVREAAARAREAGAELIAVGEEAGDADVHVTVPSRVPEALAPLVHIVRAQQLALAHDARARPRPRQPARPDQGHAHDLRVVSPYQVVRQRRLDSRRHSRTTVASGKGP